MGRQDIALKEYFNRQERVVSICNYLTKSKCFYSSNIKYISGFYAIPQLNTASRNVERDILCRAVVNGCTVLIGIENQQNINLIFPLRQMEMDYLENKRNVREIQERNKKNPPVYGKKDDFLYQYRRGDFIPPIIEVLLYWGEENWDGPKSLTDMQDIKDLPPGIVPFLSEYRLNIINIREIPDEELEKMDSDLKYVVGFLKRSKDKEEYRKYIEDNREFFSKAPKSAIEVMHACAKIDLVMKKSVYEKEEEDKEGVADMCQALDELIRDSENEGRIEGRNEGRIEGRIEGIVNSVINVLEIRGKIPEQVRQKVVDERDIDKLTVWLKLAASVTSMEEFCMGM